MLKNKPLVGLAAGLGHVLADTLGNGGNNISSTLSKAGNRAHEVLGDIGRSLSRVCENLGDGVEGVVEDSITSSEQQGEGLLDGIGDAVGSARAATANKAGPRNTTQVHLTLAGLRGRGGGDEGGGRDESGNDGESHFEYMLKL